jgi:hypothetical protein
MVPIIVLLSLAVEAPGSIQSPVSTAVVSVLNKVRCSKALQDPWTAAGSCRLQGVCLLGRRGGVHVCKNWLFSVGFVCNIAMHGQWH